MSRRCLILGLFLSLGWALAAGVPPGQAQIVSIAIVPFHDESAAAAPGDLLDKVGREFMQKLVLSYKDVLPRLVGGEVMKEPATAGVGDLAAIGKQQGAKFVVRGGILAVTWEKAGRDLKCGLQLFADIVDAESQAASALRAEGAGVQKKADLEEARRWDAYDWNSPEFVKTALGQALDAALTSLADQVHAAALDPASWASGQAQFVEGQPPVEAEAGLTPSGDPYQTDEELQQIMAQAESLIASGGAANIDITPLQQSLEGIRTALDNKLQLLQQAQDTTAVDQDISQRRVELENQVYNYTQQVSVNPPPDAALALTGGNVDGISRVNNLIEGALSLLQKIQEIRLALRGSGRDQGYDPSQDQYAGADEYYPPTEEETAGVSGLVTEDGFPVESATVTDPETGISATTDSNGSYTLAGLPGGRISNLQVSRGGRVIGTNRVDLKPGRASISDWSFRSGSGGLRATASPIAPSSLILAARPGQSGTGRIEGTVRDDRGRPVPRALVSVKGVGAVRTDSQGRYTFANVPQGNYPLTVQQPGGSAQAQQVKVGGRQTAAAPIVYRAQAPAGGKTGSAQALTPGENTLLKGRVTEGKNKALGGAKLTVVHPGGALHVYSNSGGVYQVRGLKPGAYRVLASKPGYNGTSQTVALQKGKPSTLDFQLALSSSAAVRQALASQQQKEASKSSAPLGHAPAVTKKVTPRTQAASGAKAGKTEKGQVSQTSPKTGEKTKVISTTKQAKLATGPGKTVAAAANGGVRGTVTDGKTKSPVAGATVSLKGKPSVQTDGSGQYSFRDVAPGSCAISVKKTGYRSGGGSVTIKSGQTATANYALTKTEIVKQAPTIKAPIKKQD
jgi:hypothetical protein